MSFARKLRQIWASDLTAASKLGFLVDEVRERLGGSGAREYTLNGGAVVSLRPRTTDSKVFEEVFLERIYAPYRGPGQVLVDLGANIGLSALFLDRKFGFVHIIAVEPDIDNARMLRRNLEGNVTAQVSVLQAFIGPERGFAQMLDAGYGAWGLRMGETSESGIRVLRLDEILPDVPGGVLLKCDIEGAERFVFPQITDWEDRVRFIILELHTEFFAEKQLEVALASSRYEWRRHGEIKPGAVLAVFALERGELKSTTLESECDSRSHSRGAAAV
jgi:FkbM family methyltransferase